MLIVKLEKGKKIDQALKELKGKVIKTKLKKELREREQFTKKSVKKREAKQKAIYKQRKQNEEE